MLKQWHNSKEELNKYYDISGKDFFFYFFQITFFFYPVSSF